MGMEFVSGFVFKRMLFSEHQRIKPLCHLSQAVGCAVGFEPARCMHPRFDLPALVAYLHDMKSEGSIQYTIRQIPKHIDRSLRQKSKQSRQSLNEAAIDALTKGLGLADVRPCYHDLDALAGTWQEDPGFDRAIAAQDQVDPRLWR